ncbi:GntR family transcriptional regulator [Sphingomonas mali]|uniref:GntR family transcriptional regulator n=1 Tax=Sphingomonas mali TaxID=40682 RepID=UPI0008371CE6|nr:GntR family transcriptional regulator [Sphingomonas mali]
MSALAKRQATTVIAPPAAPEAASLLADVIGEWQPAGEKGACRVARLIEENLIARDWPQGLACGSEQALAESFGVGRAVIREAMRILEVRGTARMVPGPNGGLRVTPVDPARTAGFVVGFAAFHDITKVQLRDTADALARARADRTGGAAAPEVERQASRAIDFFEDVLAVVGEHLDDGAGKEHASSILLAPEALRRSRAGQIAALLLRECSVEEWRHGHRLGSEEDLCFRLGVDRDSFRQAVRILESAGAAEANCGRGRGLISKSPRAGAVARLVSCLFASTDILPDAVMLVFERLNAEIVALAAARAEEPDCAAIEEALDQLAQALDDDDSDIALGCVFEVEEAIVRTCANPLLHLVVQSLRAYPTARMPRDPHRLRDLNREYLRLSCPLLGALRANDVRAAVRAQHARTETMKISSRSVGRPAFAQKEH